MSEKPFDKWAESATSYKGSEPDMNSIKVEKLCITCDLTDYAEIRIRSGEHFVATTPEHFIECMSWLLTNVDTDTIIDKDGVWPE